MPDRCTEMKCGGSCQYDYSLADFFCICPENAYLNSDGISCVVIEGNIFTTLINWNTSRLAYTYADSCLTTHTHAHTHTHTLTGKPIHTRTHTHYHAHTLTYIYMHIYALTNPLGHSIH